MRDKYEPLIDLPHPTSREHPRMSREARAAQFAPFAALSGFESLVYETGRTTDSFKELTEDRKSEINDCLLRFITTGEICEIIYFQPDSRKSGGEYLGEVGRILRFDECSRSIVLDSGRRISVEMIEDVRLYEER